MPPANWLCMLHRHDVADRFILEQSFSQEHVAWAVPEDVADGEEPLLGSGRRIGKQGYVYLDAIVEVCC